MKLTNKSLVEHIKQQIKELKRERIDHARWSRYHASKLEMIKTEIRNAEDDLAIQVAMSSPGIQENLMSRCLNLQKSSMMAAKRANA